MDEEFYSGVVKVDTFGFQSMAMVKEKGLKKKEEISMCHKYALVLAAVLNIRCC